MNKFPGKSLTRNVNAYVKKNVTTTYIIQLFGKGEEDGARNAIREDLCRYLPECDISEDSEVTSTNEDAIMT